jgi:hypothetical protein
MKILFEVLTLAVFLGVGFANLGDQMRDELELDFDR